MLYSYFVEKSIRQSFDHINNHRWDAAVKALAPHVHHRVSGAHALGGERHDKQTMRAWFERFGVHTAPPFNDGVDKRTLPCGLFRLKIGL